MSDLLLDNFGAWDLGGCKEVQTTNDRVTCDCTQLGHFGILFVSLVQQHRMYVCRFE